MADQSLMAKQKQEEEARLKMQAEEREYIQRSKNLPVATYPSLTGVMFDYASGYFGRDPQTFRSSYATPFKSKAEVMGYNLRSATDMLDSFLFDDLKEAFAQATTSPFKTLVPGGEK